MTLKITIKQGISRIDAVEIGAEYAGQDGYETTDSWCLARNDGLEPQLQYQRHRHAIFLVCKKFYDDLRQVRYEPSSIHIGSEWAQSHGRHHPITTDANFLYSLTTKTARTGFLFHRIGTISSPAALYRAWRTIILRGLPGFTSLKTLILYEADPPHGRFAYSKYQRRKAYMSKTLWFEARYRSICLRNMIWGDAEKHGLVVKIILASSDLEACVTTFGACADGPLPQHVSIDRIPLELDDMAREPFRIDLKLFEKQAKRLDEVKKNRPKQS